MTKESELKQAICSLDKLYSLSDTYLPVDKTGTGHATLSRYYNDVAAVLMDYPDIAAAAKAERERALSDVAFECSKTGSQVIFTGELVPQKHQGNFVKVETLNDIIAKLRAENK